MLRTNLSTRPFYNVRAVKAVLGALVVIAGLATLFNVEEVIRLAATQRSVGARAAQAEAEAARLRAEAARIRSQIDAKELGVVAAAAREANVIIDRRVFSWTGLLAHFEATLPPDARITAIQPRVETDGRMVVGVAVEARRVDDVDAFIEALEKTGAFRDVLAVEGQTAEDGIYEAIVEGTYARQPQVVEARRE
jgi:hypothetical protein